MNLEYTDPEISVQHLVLVEQHYFVYHKMASIDRPFYTLKMKCTV